MAEKDLYRLLGVSPGASPERIRSAYRKLVRRYHPDVYGGDPEVAHTNFRELTDAYETLRDPLRRREYDRKRAQELWGEGSSGPRPHGTRHEDLPHHRIRVPQYPSPYHAAGHPMHDRGPEAMQSVRRAWRKASSQSLSRHDFSRRTKLLLIFAPLSFMLLMAGLLTIPVTQPFAFALQPAYLCTGLTSHGVQFLRGDQVTFSWNAQATNYDPSSPLEVMISSSATNVLVLDRDGLNGSYAFVADGSTYHFQSCYWGNGTVGNLQFSGSYLGPII